MTTIHVQPAEGKEAYNCDTGRWINGVTQVSKGRSVMRMLKNKELIEVKAPKPESKK